MVYGQLGLHGMPVQSRAAEVFKIGQGLALTPHLNTVAHTALDLVQVYKTVTHIHAQVSITTISTDIKVHYMK